MTITVKFFASLSEQVGKKELLLEAQDDLTLETVWGLATDNHEMPTKILMAVNLEYAQLSDPVEDGDEVAYFPPVTGG